MRKSQAACLVMAGFSAVPSTSAHAASVRREAFGTMPDGSAVEAVTLSAANGVSAGIITLGTTLQALNVPDRAGSMADVTLGYDELRRRARRATQIAIAVGS